MITNVSMIRFIIDLILLGMLALGCASAKVSRAQETLDDPTPLPVQLPAPVSSPLPVLQPCDRLIAARTQFVGSLAPNRAGCRYVFQGTSGDSITIQVTPQGQSLAPTLVLFAPDGTEAMTSIVPSGTVASLIYGYRLPETGLYSLLIQAADEDAMGDFRLSLAGNTRCGGRLSGTLVIAAQLAETARYCVYNFTSPTDGQWQLTAHKLDSGADPEVNLFDEQGVQLPYTQTTGLEPKQVYELAADRTYSLLVNAAQMVGIGAFALNLQLVDAVTADPADPGLFAPGVQVHNVYSLNDNRVNLRRTPGHINKPASDILLDMPGGATLVILGAAASKDSLPWWPVLYIAKNNATYTGWVAEVTDTGTTILGAN